MSPNSAELAPPPELSPERLETLSQTIRDRLKSIDDGRSDRIDRIRKYREFHKDNFDARLKPGSVWELSNIGVPLVKGIAISYASKLEDEMAGDPPFTVKPVNPEDVQLAEIGQKYWPWEIVEQVEWDEKASETIWVLTSEGTAITKRMWSTKKSYYPRKERWLIGADGQPVLVDGNPVREGQFPIIEKVEATWLISTTRKQYLVVGKDNNGMEILGPEVTEEMSWMDVHLKDSVTHYDNAKICCIPFEDFYCSLNVPCIEESPILGHGYVMSINELVNKIRESGEGEISEEALAETGWIVEALEAIRVAPDVNDDGSKSKDKPDQKSVSTAFAALTDLGEKPEKLIGSLTNDELNKRLKFIEVYLKDDIDGDGIQEDIVCIFQPDTEKIVFCDYLVRVYSDCDNPFEVHSFFRVSGRWYGLSPYEFFAQPLDYVDKVFNRMNYRGAMSANPGEWVKPDNFISLPDERGPGWRAQLKPNSNPNDSLGYFQMPTAEGVEYQHFQFFVSLIQLMTGVSNAAQGDIASLPSTSTATGIQTIVEEGNKLYRMFIRRVKRSFKKELKGLIKLIQQNVKEDRVFRYKKGDAEIVASMTPEEIRTLDFDVDIILAKNSSKQKADSIQAGLQIVNQWLQTPQEMKPRLRPLFSQLLQVLGIPNPDDILPSVEELEQDQNNDSILQQAAEKIGAAIAQIQGANLDPKAAAVGPMMEAIKMIQAVVMKGPEMQQNGGEQQGQPEQPQMESLQV